MSRRRVTLTFDNGPTPGVTETVLEDLARHDVRVTFFVIGRKLEDPAARALAVRAAGEGHWIGNHTMTHSVQLGTIDDPEVVWAEIDAAEAQLGTLSHPDRFYRPYCAGRLGPHVLNAAAAEHLRDGHYTLALWNCIPGDWRAPDGWVDRCLRGVDARDWSVVVIHDERATAMRHLAHLLDELEARDVELVQEIPPACTPIRRGEAIAALEGLMPAAGSVAAAA